MSERTNLPGDRQGGRMAGPVIERRGQVHEGSTTDQRLLDSRGPTDWVHTDPWRVLRIQAEFVEGFGALAELGPAIGVFGSARTTVDDPNYALAEQAGARLARAGFAVITGGGPESTLIVRTRSVVSASIPPSPVPPVSRTRKLKPWAPAAPGAS